LAVFKETKMPAATAKIPKTAKGAPFPGGPKNIKGLDLNSSYQSMWRKFEAYKELVRSVAERKSRHLIVRGDPGLGKSHECLEMLEPYAKSESIRFNKATGHMTPLALYNNLFEFRGPNDVSMFDDCDSVFQTAHTMNLLKAATDTKDRREIVWGSTSSLVEIDRYQYDGSIIILTNLDMREYEKYNAFLDRVIYFDLELTPEEKIARILWILYKDYRDCPALDEVAKWMIANYRRFGKQLSIRSGVKLTELVSVSPTTWKEMAEATVLPRKPYQEGKNGRN
jgi:hypothetical protein